MPCLLRYIFFNGCPVRTPRLELKWGFFSDEVTIEAMLSTVMHDVS